MTLMASALGRVGGGEGGGGAVVLSFTVRVFFLRCPQWGRDDLFFINSHSTRVSDAALQRNPGFE